MEKQNLSGLTDEQLLEEKKKLKRSKMMSALGIGFLGGVVIFGVVGAVMSKKFVVLIPLFFPMYFIYKAVKKPNPHRELETVLKERGLD